MYVCMYVCMCVCNHMSEHQCRETLARRWWRRMSHMVTAKIRSVSPVIWFLGESRQNSTRRSLQRAEVCEQIGVVRYCPLRCIGKRSIKKYAAGSGWAFHNYYLGCTAAAISSEQSNYPIMKPSSECTKFRKRSTRWPNLASLYVPPRDAAFSVLDSSRWCQYCGSRSSSRLLGCYPSLALSWFGPNPVLIGMHDGIQYFIKVPTRLFIKIPAPLQSRQPKPAKFSTGSLPMRRKAFSEAQSTTTDLDYGSPAESGWDFYLRGKKRSTRPNHNYGP